MAAWLGLWIVDCGCEVDVMCGGVLAALPLLMSSDYREVTTSRSHRVNDTFSSDLTHREGYLTCVDECSKR